jgi:hypothetical protein
MGIELILLPMSACRRRGSTGNWAAPHDEHNVGLLENMRTCAEVCFAIRANL